MQVYFYDIVYFEMDTDIDKLPIGINHYGQPIWGEPGEGGTYDCVTRRIYNYDELLEADKHTIKSMYETGYARGNLLKNTRMHDPYYSFLADIARADNIPESDIDSWIDNLRDNEPADLWERVEEYCQEYDDIEFSYEPAIEHLWRTRGKPAEIRTLSTTVTVNDDEYYFEKSVQPVSNQSLAEYVAPPAVIQNNQWPDIDEHEALFRLINTINQYDKQNVSALNTDKSNEAGSYNPALSIVDVTDYEYIVYNQALESYEYFAHNGQTRTLFGPVKNSQLVRYVGEGGVYLHNETGQRLGQKIQKTQATRQARTSAAVNRV